MRRVGGSTHCLWMELRSEVRLGLVHDALVTLVVDVGKKSLPSGRQVAVVDCIAMVLRRNVALAGQLVDDGLILATISEGKLYGLSTSR